MLKGEKIMKRNKWEDIVSYTEVSKPDFGEKKKLSMFNGGNGDLYLAVHEENKGFAGKAIRIERSGGASTRNPNMVRALTILYDAIAGNDSPYYIIPKESFTTFNILNIFEDIKNILELPVSEQKKEKEEYINNFQKEFVLFEKK